jgi:hypothetical protein
MAILNKLTWIDSSALTRFILSAQVRGHSFHHPASLVVCVFCLRYFTLGPRGWGDRGPAGRYGGRVPHSVRRCRPFFAWIPWVG